MKKSMVIISMLMLLLVFVLSLFNRVYASADILSQLGAMSAVMTPDDSSDAVKSSINRVIGVIQVAGTGIALITLSMLGIKYMLASPSEKADVKKQVMPFAIGCILLFGAVTVVGLIANLADNSLSGS